MSGFICRYFGITALVKTLIAVNAVASGTAHSPVMSSALISLVAQMASIAVTQIGKGGKLRICLYIFGRNGRDLFQLGRKLPGEVAAISFI
jgi:hypothetical protein